MTVKIFSNIDVFFKFFFLKKTKEPKKRVMRKIKRKYKDDENKMVEKIIKFKEDQVYKIIFAPILKKYETINKKAMYNNFFKV